MYQLEVTDEFLDRLSSPEVYMDITRVSVPFVVLAAASVLTAQTVQGVKPPAGFDTRPIPIKSFQGKVLLKKDGKYSVISGATVQEFVTGNDQPMASAITDQAGSFTLPNPGDSGLRVLVMTAPDGFVLRQRVYLSPTGMPLRFVEPTITIQTKN